MGVMIVRFAPKATLSHPEGARRYGPLASLRTAEKQQTFSPITTTVLTDALRIAVASSGLAIIYARN